MISKRLTRQLIACQAGFAQLKAIRIAALCTVIATIGTPCLAQTTIDKANSTTSDRTNHKTIANSGPALNKTIYISDNLKTALRTGGSTKHRISAFLSSGQPLTVQSYNNEWVQVKVIGSSKSGWVSRQHIQSHLGAQAMLARQEATIAKLTAQQTSSTDQQQALNTQLQETQNELEQMTKQFEQLNEAHEKLQAISKTATANHAKMQQMREKIATIKTQSNELEITNILLEQDNYNRGIIHGLIAVVFGILITLIIPKMKRKRSSSQWD